jgi:hypothetical protein
MARIRLTFFCELDSQPLDDLLTSALIADLAHMNASLSMGLRDLSEQRARVVQRLNRANIPVVAWLLLPKEQGYWFNLENAQQALAFYASFKAWSAQHGLRWDGISLDIEPDIHEVTRLAHGDFRLLPRFARRLFDRRILQRARSLYIDLIAEIQADGYRVDSYQFPVIQDERLARSTVLQRLVGIVDLPVDREVWMVYTSFVRRNGAGLLASYGPQAQSVGLGSTGGGVDGDFGKFTPLTWEELARDMRLAWYFCEDIHIFSLEGCVQQGFLPQLKAFEWDYPLLIPERGLAQANRFRSALRALLWVGTNLGAILFGAFAGLLAWKTAQAILRRRHGGQN